MKIFIGNVAPEATSSDLRKVFEGTGLEIQKCDKVGLAVRSITSAISDIEDAKINLYMMVTYISQKVEGKGIGFAHVCSSKGVKEINRYFASQIIKHYHLLF